MGLTKEDYEGEAPEEIFFDQVMMDSWDVFCAMSTQWRSSGAGAYGLDYNVLPFMFDTYKIGNREMALNDLRVMEIKALQIMQKK